MTEKTYQEIRVNERCLKEVIDVINSLEKYYESQIDSDMPFLRNCPDIESIISYFKVVENRIMELLKQQKSNIDMEE